MSASMRRYTAATKRVLGEIRKERGRQRVKFGADQYRTHSDERCLAILAEEFGEVAREICEAGSRGDARAVRPNLRTELIQVAAVATAWAEAIDMGREVTQ